MMKIEEAIDVLKKYVELTKPLFGDVSITIAEEIDAAKFPDELHKLKNQNKGLYIIWSKNDRRVIYVGIAVDIPRRIYQHIGKGYSWSRGSTTAKFPYCTLADGRNWLKESTQAEM
ncbi:MAG: GIY-YIG nuclease family protein [Nitrospirae bacterium]|nr:GIY-YIG nuclease family protein [Nitrospirota bacterium]MDE3217962.1 GIY-YIG nuclease family protein [Nitrospirota bacterium]